MTKNVIDLFCGAGGLSLGFKMAGFDVLLGTDHFEAAGRTFELSHPRASFLGGDIRSISDEDLKRASRLDRQKLDVLVGGPPCQGFSVYNHNRGIEDVRTTLYKDYLRIVEKMNPTWVVIENVPGMFSVDDGSVIGAIVSGLQVLGYSVDYRVIKMEDYGVPQLRRRVVFVANNRGLTVNWKEPTHGEGKLPFVTVKDAIGDLPYDIQNEGCETHYLSDPNCSYQKYARQASQSALVSNHRSARLSNVNLERLKHIPAGGSWRDIPFDLLPKGMQRAKRSDHTKRYGRLTWDGLSSTILTKCDIHWGAFIHPERDRPLSVREAARFQGFPDSVTFQGSLTQQYEQVGNAVPPIVGRAIAETILASEMAEAGDRSDAD
jgi:DNA (cytosine-5)-methyltransferase 1